jgi:hypothetical protein
MKESPAEEKPATSRRSEKRKNCRLAEQLAEAFKILKKQMKLEIKTL